MSLRGLRSLEYQPKNDSSASLTQLPATILDAFIPGYSFLSKLLLDVLGFDISNIVSVALLLFALSTGGQFLWKQLSAQFLRFYSSSITIDAYDPIYDHILAWASENKALQKIRSLRGHSPGERTDEEDSDIKVEEDFGEDSIFNFNNWAAKAAPRYEPHTSSGLFWHKGISGSWNCFQINRDRERVPGGWMGMMVQDQEKLTLTVVGRSTQPLKDLIVETRDAHLAHQTSMTVIRRPSPKEQRGRGRHAWNKVASRPSRPMATVVLDDFQKATVLKDINDFLHPRTPRWYANRGIPYRRGYLFYGPPGTGKTSLSFALAGVFGLDIYCLSLSEATLTEEDLIVLFNSLPKRCVVLLEDIDTAGVLRKKNNGDETEKENKPKRGKRGKGEKEKDEEDTKEVSSETTAAAATIAKEVARAMQSATDSSEAARKGPSLNNQGITMSGLLNAIDGVASQEGRVLVMTTNYPEKLDDALIRPGRVDMKIEFTLASRHQIRELFSRMYFVDTDENTRQPTKISQILPKSAVEAMDEGKSEKVVATANGHVDKTSSLNVFGHDVSSSAKRASLPTPPATPRSGKSSAGSPGAHEKAKDDNGNGVGDNSEDPQSFADDVERLAERFADALPEAVFSPAEIQGFLLTRKKSPVQAVLDVAAWRDEEIHRKERKKNVAVGKDEGKGGEDVEVAKDEN